MNLTAEISSCGDDNTAGRIKSTKPCCYTGNFAIFGTHFRNLSLFYIKIFGMLKHRLHKGMIFYPVALYSERMNGRTFTFIEHS